jgi:dTDP-4-dehydrorhamnose reductase
VIGAQIIFNIEILINTICVKMARNDIYGMCKNVELSLNFNMKETLNIISISKSSYQIYSIVRIFLITFKSSNIYHYQNHKSVSLFSLIKSILKFCYNNYIIYLF